MDHIGPCRPLRVGEKSGPIGLKSENHHHTAGCDDTYIHRNVDWSSGFTYRSREETARLFCKMFILVTDMMRMPG